MLHDLENASTKIEEEGEDPMVLSLDVNQLYPNLDIVASAKEVSQEIIEQKIEFQNIDYVAGARYIAANCTRLEIAKAGLAKIIQE